jgi:hypothetical protein
MNTERVLQLLQIFRATLDVPAFKPIHDQAVSDLMDVITQLTAPKTPERKF